MASAPSTARFRRVRSLAGAVPLALLVAVAIWEIGAISRAGTDVPDPGDWERASAYVREHRRPGELVVFAPRWLDPVGRLHLGDLIPVEMAARMDAARYGVIWELAARGARAGDTRGLEPTSERRFGDLAVRRYEREPARVVTDFREALPGARVSGRPARAPRVSLEEVGFGPHRCVKVVPRPGDPVTITFPDAELGDRLVGYAGLADVFTRRDVRAPGVIEVRVDGERVAEVRAGVTDGWVRFEAPTEARPGAEVTFVARAGAPDRLICFAAEARE